MTWLGVLKIILQLAAFIARRAERSDIERSLINELKVLNGEKVDTAERARDDIISGRVPERSDDPYKRD